MVSHGMPYSWCPDTHHGTRASTVGAPATAKGGTRLMVWHGGSGSGMAYPRVQVRGLARGGARCSWGMAQLKAQIELGYG